MCAKHGTYITWFNHQITLCFKAVYSHLTDEEIKADGQLRIEMYSVNCIKQYIHSYLNSLIQRGFSFERTNYKSVDNI